MGRYSLLVSNAVGWTKLSNDERKKLFLSSDPSGWRWTALALAKNGRRNQLMEWARERPPSDHLDVVWILKHDLPKEWSDAELKFWLACAKRDLRKVAYALRGSDRQIPINFREPICADLEREITKPTVEEDGTQPAYDLFATVDVLDSWGNPDDTPLLRKYLKHPLHETSSRFRSNLQYMLKKRGVRAPYLQEETSPFPNNQSESNSS